MTIPRSDVLKPRPRLGTPSRSQLPQKLVENTTDADKLKTIPISPTLPTNGQVPMYDAVTGQYRPSTVAAAVSATVEEAPVGVFSAQELAYGASYARFVGPTDAANSGNLVLGPGGFQRVEVLNNTRDGGAVPFVNAPTLTGAGITTTTQTAITISAVGPTNGQYIRIDFEAMLVTGGGNTTSLTVARARLQTTAATHSAGVAVLRVNVESVVHVTGGLRATGGVATSDLSLQGYSTHELAIRATFTEPIASIADGQTEFGYMTLHRGGHNHTTDVNYAVEIDTQGGIGFATFRWSDDGGATWDASLVLIPGASAFIHLQNGVTISFSQGSYFVGNRWDFTAIGIPNQVELLRADTVNEKLTFSASGGKFFTINNTGFGQYINTNVGELAGGAGVQINANATETVNGGILTESFLVPTVGANNLVLINLYLDTSPDNRTRTGTNIYGALEDFRPGGGTFTAAAARRVIMGTYDGIAAPVFTALYALKIERSTVAYNPAAASGTVTAIEIPDLGHANFATVTGLDILDQTAGGTATYNIRQRGTVGINLLNAPTWLGASAYMADSAGNRHLTFASSATAVAVTSSFAGGLRVNGTLGVGQAPSTTSRLAVSIWPNLGAGAHNLIIVGLSGVQSANATAKRGFGFTGQWDINGLTLTNFAGIFSAPGIDDSAGGGLLASYAAFQGQLSSQGSSPAITDSAVFWALAPNNSGAVPVTHRGVYIENQGGVGSILNTWAVDIAAQSGASTFTGTIRALGTAPSIHEPPMMVGATTVPGAIGGPISNTAANPTVVTTTVAHRLTTGETVTISGSNAGGGFPPIGPYVVTVLSPTTFSIPYDSTAGAGTTGTAVRAGVGLDIAGIIEMDGDVYHGGTRLGFYGVIPVARPGAYTQTYATADKTHAAFTSADIGAFTGGTVGFLDAAERDGVRTQFNALRADVADVKQLANSIIDDLQALGLAA